MTTWTDERVEILKKLWPDGLSASQIGEELGGLSRNAVIGKAHRLGLSGRAKSASYGSPRPRKPPSEKRMLKVVSRARGNTAIVTIHDVEAYEPPEHIMEHDNVISVGQRRTLLELTELTCRWPIGDPGTPEFFFCGGQSVPSGPYCGYHSRVAYQPRSSLRERRVFRAYRPTTTVAR